ncbi:unnamed protein product [Cuscuta campestris]|uniref:Uncharacterized protein n=1 Tax=Cuscuta campestris TaxID=132261 RepID=A0A484MYJ3_9ASTE|nr:unnamed protein product [Cuscuta campestris]
MIRITEATNTGLEENVGRREEDVPERCELGTNWQGGRSTPLRKPTKRGCIGNRSPLFNETRWTVKNPMGVSRAVTVLLGQ